MAELKCSDGAVVQISAEIEAELRKAFEPPHVWKHGDVFENRGGVIMIYVDPIFGGGSQIFYLGEDTNATCPVEAYLEDATFLYNIKEKL